MNIYMAKSAPHALESQKPLKHERVQSQATKKREVDEKAEIPFEEVRNWLGRVADAEEDAGISSFRCTDFEGVLDPTAVDELESSADDLEDLGGNNSAASASEVVTDSLGILRGHERGGDPVAT